MCCIECQCMIRTPRRKKQKAYQEILDPSVLTLAAVMKVSLTLGQLVVVMRESKIDTTRVDVHLLAKFVGSHNGALNVPTWATGTPRAGPIGLTGLRLFPKGKVTRTLLASQSSRKGTLSLLLQGGVVLALGAKASIGVTGLLEGANVEVDRTVGLVGESLLDNLLNEGDDLRNVFGNASDDIGRKDVQSLHIVSECLLHRLCEVGKDGLIASVDGLLVERIEVR